MTQLSPVLLAIDTATQECSTAAVAEGISVLKDKPSGNGHSEAVIGMVDEALKEAGISLEQCDAVVFGAGPGAFTGLRVACGVAQGLAWASGKPVVPAGNLEALALKVLSSEAPGTRVIAALDARMHQSYCAVYEKAAEDGARPAEVEPPQLVNPEDIPGILSRTGAAVAAGSAVAAFPEAFSSSNLRKIPDAAADALDLARLGRLLFLEGKAIIPELAAPLYIRNRVALTIEERKAGESL